MPELKIQNIEITKLRPYPNNAKRHPESQIAALRQSIEEFGFINPIIADTNLEIIAGHARYHAAKAEGKKQVPVIILEISKEKAKRLRIADNRIAELAEWDTELLQAEIADWSPEELALTGWDANSLQTELGISNWGNSAPSDTDNLDEVPIQDNAELIAKWKPELGKLWTIGQHRLLCGDCTVEANVKRLMDGGNANMVFTDPPYGMNLDTDWSLAKSKLKFYKEKGCKGHGNKYEKVIGDNADFKPELITKIFKQFNYCKEIFIWGADYYFNLLDMKNGSLIVWDKRIEEQADKMFGSCFELCYSRGRHRREIARIKWAGIFGTEQEPDKNKSRLHPTQKPVGLAEWFLNKYSKPENIIVDLFAGSGSTLIACEKTKRICYGMEIDPGYCAVILERLTTVFPALEIKVI